MFLSYVMICDTVFQTIYFEFEIPLFMWNTLQSKYIYLNLALLVFKIIFTFGSTGFHLYL